MKTLENSTTVPQISPITKDDLQKISFDTIDAVEEKFKNIIRSLNPNIKFKTMQIKPASPKIFKYVPENDLFVIQDNVIHDDWNYILTFDFVFSEMSKKFPENFKNKEIQILYLLPFPIYNLFLHFMTLTQEYQVTIFISKDDINEIKNSENYIKITENFPNLFILKTLEDAEKLNYIKIKKD